MLPGGLQERHARLLRWLLISGWLALISEHVMLIGSLLGDQSLQGAAEQLLVGLGSGADDVDRQVSLGHGGSEAGMTGDCGEAPRRVGASSEEQRPELRALLFALALWALMAAAFRCWMEMRRQQSAQGFPLLVPPCGLGCRTSPIAASCC